MFGYKTSTKQIHSIESTDWFFVNLPKKFQVQFTAFANVYLRKNYVTYMHNQNQLQNTFLDIISP